MTNINFLCNGEAINRVDHLRHFIRKKNYFCCVHALLGENNIKIYKDYFFKEFFFASFNCKFPIIPYSFRRSKFNFNLSDNKKIFVVCFIEN